MTSGYIYHISIDNDNQDGLYILHVDTSKEIVTKINSINNICDNGNTCDENKIIGKKYHIDSTYDISYQKLIYKIYFDYLYKNNEKIKNMRDKIKFTGMQFEYNYKEDIICKFFHTDGKINGKYIKYMFWSRIEIDYIDNKKHGLYIEYDKNNNIISKCNYVDDKIEGDYFRLSSKGKFECNCINNIINGCLNYIDGKKHINTFYINGKQDGIQKIYIDGKLYAECEYKDDKLNGIYNIYDNKFKKIYTYKDDKMDGKCYEYIKYKNKYILINESSYKTGLRDGIFKFYDKRGKLIKDKLFKNNKKLSEFNYRKKTMQFFKYKIKKSDYTYDLIDVYIKTKYYDENKICKNITKEKHNIVCDKYSYYGNEETYDYESKFDETMYNIYNYNNKLGTLIREMYNHDIRY
jgi:antitoxin component YwqK of YwqJK toxin-antitoxin module